MKAVIHMAYSNKLGGSLIRFFTWSKWNHVGIQIGEDIYDSTFERGVGIQSLKQFRESWDQVESFEIELPNPELAKKFLNTQVAKDYDWTAIFGFVFRRNWSRDKHWFCSELVAQALKKGGIAFEGKPHRVTPRDIILITYAVRI